MAGYGCSKCSGKEKSNTEKFVMDSIKVHGDTYNYDTVIYTGSNEKVKIICKKHGDFMQRASTHLEGHGCPICKKYKGELKILKFLKENNINFKDEYYFKDLKDKNLLYFDFAVLDKNKNLICLIEFNGKQHYKFNAFFHKTAEKFEASKIRDQLKIDYCFKNNIPLHIIRYDDEVKYKLGEIFNIYFDVIFE